MRNHIGGWKAHLAILLTIHALPPVAAQTSESTSPLSSLSLIFILAALIIAGLLLHRHHQHQAKEQRDAYQLAALKAEITKEPEDERLNEELQADIEGRKSHLRQVLAEMNRGLEDLKS